jgi:hypothetical protein
MTTEELMKPRWKVIAEWPHMTTYWIGRIIMHGQMGVETQINYDKYPHIFQKLEWYEEISIEDMPQYVIVDDECVYKIKEWKHENGFTVGYIDSNRIIPEVITVNIYTNTKAATEQEYLNYKTNPA